ncbi:S1C family serine protease [Blastococcus sp. SYSU DS0616]
MSEHQHQYPGAGQQYGWQPPLSTPHQPTTPQPVTSPGYPGYGGLPSPAAEQPPSRRGSRLRIGLAGLVAGALIGGGAGAGVTALLDEPVAGTSSSAAAQSVTTENPERATTATAAAAKAAPSVVTVYVTTGTSAGSGSGVVLTADGYVLTNNHVVAADGAGSGTVQVRTADGTLYDAEVVGTDPAFDLAVLRLEGADDLVPATFADSDEVQVGDIAVAIGAPLGLSNTVTDGIISATGRAVATGSTQDDATVLDAIQTDAAINPGNSGGALVDGAGEVIGINTAIATVASGIPGAQGQSGNIGVGFAIPGNTAQRVAQEIIETGTATRAFLGVTPRTAADDQNREVGTGAEVVTVHPGSAAEEAGLEPGDVVTAVGKRPVTTSTELTAAIRSRTPGETVQLTVRRGSDTRTVEVTLGSTS